MEHIPPAASVYSPTFLGGADGRSGSWIRRTFPSLPLSLELLNVYHAPSSLLLSEPIESSHSAIFAVGGLASPPSLVHYYDAFLRKEGRRETARGGGLLTYSLGAGSAIFLSGRVLPFCQRRSSSELCKHSSRRLRFA